MKKVIIILWTSLALILSILYLNFSQNQPSSTGLETTPVTEAEMRPALDATIQILMFSTDSLDALDVGVGRQQTSLQDALSRNDVAFRYNLGLGTLVSHHGEITLITHDHWGSLDRLGMVQFRNAAGDQLLELDGGTFKDLIRYQDGGTMILGRPPGEDRSDYLSALVWTSEVKYGRRLVPAILGTGESVGVGEPLTIVRQGRNGSNSVELIKVTVEAIENQRGQPVYELRSVNGETIMPGDSGGGLWLGDSIVGNMWMSTYTYAWNRGSLEREQNWTETSFAAGLPDALEEITQSLGAVEVTGDMESPTIGEDF
jgi:hypothetical protein